MNEESIGLPALQPYFFFYAMSRDVKMKNKLRTEGFVILGRVMFTFYGLL